MVTTAPNRPDSDLSPMERAARYEDAADRFYAGKMSLEDFERVRREYNEDIELAVRAIASRRVHGTGPRIEEPAPQSHGPLEILKNALFPKRRSHRLVSGSHSQ